MAAAQVATNPPPAVPGATPVTIEHIKVHAPTIEGNLEGESPDRDVLVVLPPSYARSPQRRYPMLYALHGYSIGAEQWSNEIHLADAAAGAFAKGAQEMIIVLPDSKTIPRIHVVYIVLPNAMHAEYTIRAFTAGKHVLCEKPMANSIGECEAMIAAGKAANRRLMIAYRCHYEPLNLAAMRAIRTGKVGRPKLVITEMGKQTNLADPSDAWRLDMAMSGGGAPADMGIYGINASRYLLNEEPVEVRA
jgi:predicted dehydrogenase